MPNLRRRRLWRRIAAGFVVFLVLACGGAWQIDMIRQTVRITYLSWTGGLWKLHGRVERHLVDSTALGEQRQVLVYLPPGYDAPENRRRRYPVLYLLHGFPDPGDGWARFGLAPQLVDQNIVQNGLPPLLIVLPDAHGKLGKFGDGEYMDAPMGADKPGTRLASFINSDVPPWVDHHFRTVTSPAGRILAGSSTGAYGAVNLGLQRPDLWGNLIALSGYYEPDLKHFGRELWGPTPDPKRLAAENPITRLADATKTSKTAQWSQTFVYLGDGYKDYDDIQQQTALLDTALTNVKIDHAHHRLYGHHSWDLWRAMLVDGLTTVAPHLEKRFR